MQTTDVQYLVVSDVLAIHERLMRSMGEDLAPLIQAGAGRLDSALARPQWAALYNSADLCEQAALLGIGIAQAHAFENGNKRLGYLATVVFLRDNGHPLPAEHALDLGKLIESAVEHLRTVIDVAAWLRSVVPA